MSGEIRKPGFYPITNNINLKNLTSFAGGATNLGKSGNYEIFYSEKDIQKINFDESENIDFSSSFPNLLFCNKIQINKKLFSLCKWFY